MTPERTPLDAWVARKIGSHDGQLSRSELEHYQVQQLRATVQHIRARSRFYRRHLADAPTEISSLRDLEDLPFTTAEDIRAHPLQFLCVSQDAIHRVVTLDSSGTTGTPKRISFTRDDQELTLDFFHIGMSTFTSANDRVLILLPGATPGSVGDLLASALQRLGAIGIVHGPIVEVAATLALMREEQVQVLVGTPTQVLALARHPQAQGLRLKSVLLTTDHVPRAIAQAVEQAWGCTVYNHYGMTEMGLGGGVNCQAGRGYHMREADLLCEIVHPAGGQAVAEGEYGELVFTTLTRRGMPLLRYRTGDISRFIPGTCPCGTALKTLEYIRQRSSGIVLVGTAGRLTMADLDEALFALEGLVQFTATLSRGAPDQLYIDAYVTATTADHGARISSALDTIPALRRARQSQQLALVVKVHQYEINAVPQLAKRVIVLRS